MSEQHKKIYDYVKETLNSESKKILIDFFDYLLANEFTLVDDGGYKFAYLESDLCLVHIYNSNDYWIYWNYDVVEHKKFPINDDLKIFIQKCAKICTGACGCPGKPPENPQISNILGKEYDNICSHCTLAFGNINADDMENVKKVADLCKLIIIDTKKS